MLRAADAAPAATPPSTISQITSLTARRLRLALGLSSSRDSIGIEPELSWNMGSKVPAPRPRWLLRIVKSGHGQRDTQAGVRVLSRQGAVMQVDRAFRDGQPEADAASRGVTRVVCAEE